MAAFVTNINSLQLLRQFKPGPTLQGLTLIWALLLGGCTAPPLLQRIDTAEAIAAGAGLEGRVIHGRRFNFRIYQRRPRTPASELVIYIEGDGLAWASRRRISENPTPVNPVALRLAARDPAPALAYIGRPCQYLPLAPQPGCGPWAWTSGRYSREILAAFMAAVTRLKDEFKSERLGLVGYSGGGAIAALLAAEREDVAWLATVAGNLNPRLWARLHGVSPLRDSLNPTNWAPRLETVPQLHLVGADDAIMPAAVAGSYRRAMGSVDRVSIVSVPGQDHGCCWQQIWPQPLCNAKLSAGIASCTSRR